MKNRYIYTEGIGNQAFYIVEVDAPDGYQFVWLDKYGIANIFDSMEQLALYLEGDLSCERVCVEPYETGIEGMDFIDHYFGIEGE